MLHAILAPFFLGLVQAATPAPAAAPSAQEVASPPWTGLWWGDFDGDAKADVLVLGAAGPARLLRNDGAGGFDDATARAGLAEVRGATSAAWRDVDGDGRLDLLLVVPGGMSRLLRNVDGAGFEDVGAPTGLPLDEGLLAACFLDFDGDGAADLLLATARAQRLFRGAGRFAFQEVELALGPAPMETAADVTALDGDDEPPPDPLAPPPAPSGPAVAGVKQVPPGTLASGVPDCPPTVEDWSSPGSCLAASSAPTMGMLWPLSLALNVDAATGFVGMGTSAPQRRLDVVGGGVRADGAFETTLTTGAPLKVVSTQLVANLNADRLDGFEAADFSRLGGSIGTAELEDGSVTRQKLADFAVGPGQLEPGSVYTNHLIDLGVSTGKLADLAVDTSKLANDAVTSAKLATDAVGNKELAPNAVSSAEIQDNTVTTADLGFDSVTTAILADGAVTNAKLGDGSVTTAKLTEHCVYQTQLATGAVNTVELVDLAVTSAKLANGAVTNAKLADGSITTAKLTEHCVYQTQLATDSVNTVELVDGAVTGPKIDDGAVSANKLAFGSVNSSKIQDGSIASADVSRPMTMNGSTTTLELSQTGSGAALEATSYSASAIEASCAGTSGAIYGVEGSSASSSGAGVLGYSTHDNGTGVLGTTASGSGVKGEASGYAGKAIYGIGDYDAGYADGVVGTASQQGGYGVWGNNSDPDGSGRGVYGRSAGSVGRGVYGTASSASGVNTGVYGNTSSATGYGVYSSGSFAATGTKSFVQPHPSDPTKQVRFVCLEGNESGTYFRGSGALAGGVAVIEVPEEFRLVTEEEGLTVQVTALGRGTLWVEAKGLESIVVRGSADVAFDYFVNGVRRGFADHVAIEENHAFVPDEAGVPYGTQYPEALRRILVENGTLNPDFTPNEGLATSLGRRLRQAGERE